MKNALLICILITLPLTLLSQKDSTAIQRIDSTWKALKKDSAGGKLVRRDSAMAPGEVSIIKDERIDELEERYDESFELSGFRVQVHSGSEREQAKKVKSEFMKLYPEVKAYEIYQQPNFKIRVGNFKNRLQGQDFLHKIREDFPGAFIVPDKLEIEGTEEKEKEKE